MRLFTPIREQLTEINEVSIAIETKKELYELKDFIDYCLKEIENQEFDHVHFNDYLRKTKNTIKKTDIIIAFLEQKSKGE